MLNAFLMFMVKQQLIFDLRTFVANSTLSRLRAFGGALLAKIWWEGARKHFIQPGAVMLNKTREELLFSNAQVLGDSLCTAVQCVVTDSRLSVSRPEDFAIISRHLQNIST